MIFITASNDFLVTDPLCGVIMDKKLGGQNINKYIKIYHTKYRSVLNTHFKGKLCRGFTPHSNRPKFMVHN